MTLLAKGQKSGSSGGLSPLLNTVTLRLRQQLRGKAVVAHPDKMFIQQEHVLGEALRAEGAV